MAKKQPARVAETIDVLRPYLNRALTDPAFRDDLKDALEAAREVYGPLAKANGGISNSARILASDKKAQKHLKRALEDLQNATKHLQGKKRKRRGRKAVLLAGVVVGTLYNPWTGPQTRSWLVDQIAGSDDLQPLEDLVPPMPDGVAEAADAAEDAETVSAGA